MNKKSIFAIVAVAIVLVVATSGCVDNVESITDQCIFIDPSNGVMYGVYWIGINVGGYDLVNADGTPKVINNSARYFSNKDLNVYYIGNDYTDISLSTDCYLDSDTGVMYLMVYNSALLGERAVLFVMLNTDGRPKTIYDSSYYDVINLQEEKRANMFTDDETGVVYLKLYNAIIPMVDQYGNYKTVNN